MKFGDALRLVQGHDYIKSKYHAYLQGERNVEREIEVTTKLLSIPERDRTKSWSASGAGTCLRARQFSYLGMKGKAPDDHAMNIFLNGTYVHIRHQVVGMAAGYLTDVEVPVRHEGYNLKGTMDAVDATGALVEYKSINQNGFMQVRQFGAKPEHKHQVNSYFLATGHDYARIVYENKNTNDLLEFEVQRDPHEIDIVVSDLEDLQLATNNDMLLPMLAECTRKEGRYRWCPFASQCPKGAQIMGKSDIPHTSSSASA